MDHMCLQSPQTRRRTIWSITGRLDKEIWGSFLEPIAFVLTVSATLHHRPARIPRVSVQPLFAHHGDERGKQGDHEACIHEAGNGDDLARRAFLNRWNGGGLTGDGGLIEGEENGTEDGSGLLVGIGLEARVNIDDKSGADGGEQTRL